MKISYNWIKDYLNIDYPADKVAEILTSIGLEVEHFDTVKNIEGGLEGLITGYVEECVKHPNADKLSLTKVNVGLDEPLQIVCGAPNVAAGQKVVVAQSGTTIYPVGGESFTIGKRKVRGEVSNGMICAEDEIGIGTDHDGIIVLPEDTPIGVPATEIYNVVEDQIFEIGLTPNRSDATCHIGVVKDLLAAIKVNENFEGEVTMPDVSAFKIDNTNFPIAVEVKDVAACPRYTGVTITGVTIKESPEWMQEKLWAIGVRPINNIVDITNFVLHELGQPLHAFDADKVKGKKIVVQKLPEGTTFKTLDEIERKLGANDLMICNETDGKIDGMCIAGVFGGIESGVTDNTKNIFLESACFEAIGLRKTSQKHNLRTDAAMRFEKGVDPNISVYALKRAALLIKELAGGEISSEIVDIYPSKVERPEITVRYKRVNTLAGIDIPDAKTNEILEKLEMETVKKTDDSITVKIPTNKVDVLREIDLIEEILRIYGFNNIPIPTKVNGTLSYASESDKSVSLKNKISDYLAGNGFYEMMNNSITQSKYYENIVQQKNVVPILNSLTSELDSLRRNMLFSGLEAIAYNQNRKNNNLRLFEMGTTYSTASNAPKGYAEQDNLSIFVAGNKNEATWEQASSRASFFDLKRAVNNVLDKLGLNQYKSKEISEDKDSEENFFQYGLSYQKNGQQFVNMGLIKPEISKAMDVNGEVFAAFLNWDTITKLIKNESISFEELAKYPAVKRDIALLLDDHIQFEEIEAISKKLGKQLLTDINLFDVYKDKKLGEGKKSYAVGFTFLDKDKTLTKKEIDKLMSKLVYQFEQQLGAQQK